MGDAVVNGGSFCSGDCSLLFVVFYWQQWVTLIMMSLSLMMTPLTEHKFIHLACIVTGFLVLWSGGWYTGGVHPWT